MPAVLSPPCIVGVQHRNRVPTPISEWPHQNKLSSTLWLGNGRAAVQLSQATPSSCVVWEELRTPLCSWRGGVQILVEFDCRAYQRGCLWWQQDGTGAKSYKTNCYGPDLSRVTANPAARSFQGWNLEKEEEKRSLGSDSEPQVIQQLVCSTNTGGMPRDGTVLPEWLV